MEKCRICNIKKKIYISGICKQCFNHYPSSFDKNNPYNKIHIINCNKHGLFMGGSWNALCPDCLEDKKYVNCIICNKKFKTEKSLKHINDSINICNKCFDNLCGNGNNIKNCNIHGYYKSVGTTDKCPKCYCKEVYCSNPNCKKLLNFKILENDNKKYYCSQKCSHLINNKILAANNQKEGVCYNCKQIVKRRTATGLGIDCGCSKKILTKHNQSGKMRKISRQNMILMHKDSKYYCNDCKAITRHNYYGSCLICMHKNQDYSHLAFHYEYCNICKNNTLHNGSICCKCNPSSNGQFKSDCYYEFCSICNRETPHNLENNCQVCLGEKIWCNHCQKFETISYNSIPDHWIYYKSRTLKWIKENNELVKFLEKYIDGFNNIIDKNISGIYCWYVNNKPWYIGQSADILSRYYDHMKSFYENPEYFDFKQRRDINEIINDKSYNIKIKVLEECDKKCLTNKELY